MNRLFTRVYLALGAVILGSIAVVVVLAPPADQGSLGQQIHSLTGVSPEEIALRLGPTSGVNAAEDLGEQLGMPVALLPEEAVTGSVGDFARRNLAQGTPVVQLHDSGPAIYIPLPGQPMVATLRPGPPTHPWTVRRAALLAALVLAGIGGALLLLIRPVEQQLQAISGAASRIGEGDLGSRAEVSRSDASGMLARSFNGMAKRVQNMLEDRKALLHGVSHELRTPLARLRFALELLTTAGDAEDRTRRIDEMLGDVGELEALVSELLQYAELESGGGNIRREDVDLSQLVEGLAHEAGRLRHGLTVELEVAELAPLALDPRLTQRSLANLVNNAARYAEGRLKVTLRRENKRVEVLVDDDGPGVPEENREAIFQPFVRLDEARSRDTGGIGLGLALASRAARGHDGDIEVEESPLGGARFTWWVPEPQPEPSMA